MTYLAIFAGEAHRVRLAAVEPAEYLDESAKNATRQIVHVHQAVYGSVALLFASHDLLQKRAGQGVGDPVLAAVSQSHLSEEAH